MAVLGDHLLVSSSNYITKQNAMRSIISQKLTLANTFLKKKSTVFGFFYPVPNFLARTVWLYIGNTVQATFPILSSKKCGKKH